MDMPNAIRVRGLRKSYGERVAVDHVDLDVAWGECVAVLGPNGAGKSTTIEILEGYRRAESGQVTVAGVDPGSSAADAAWRSRIGIVLQQSQPAEELTAREILGQYASFYLRPRVVADTIDLVGLTEHADRRVKRLSGGQQRRLDVALGIIGRPEVLFLDEPTTGFDPEARHQFWDLIRSLKAEGTTIVLTTHYLEEAAQLADRVVVLTVGRVVADTTPDQLGARDHAPTEVIWTEDGVRHQQTTATPTSFVTSLSARLGGGEIPDLQVLRRSLEDAYLELVKGS